METWLSEIYLEMKSYDNVKFLIKVERLLKRSLKEWRITTRHALLSNTLQFIPFKIVGPRNLTRNSIKI